MPDVMFTVGWNAPSLRYRKNRVQTLSGQYFHRGLNFVPDSLIPLLPKDGTATVLDTAEARTAVEEEDDYDIMAGQKATMAMQTAIYEREAREAARIEQDKNEHLRKRQVASAAEQDASPAFQAQLEAEKKAQAKRNKAKPA